VFFGETAITLDSKGRMAIPTRHREELLAASNNHLVLTYSPFDSGALWLYPEAEWEKVRDEVMALSTFAQSHRSLQRRLVGSATPIEPDANGRILLPQTHRQVTGLEKRAVFMGMGTHFEIWNETILSQKRAEEERTLGDSTSEEMAKLVL